MMPRLQTTKVYRKAFTLIELLVVIAIFAILSSMLTPSLSKAMDQAKLITCQNNYKQLYVGLTMYLDSSNGVLPGGAGNKTGSAECMRLRSDDAPNPFMGIGPLFDSGSLDDSALKAGFCPTWQEGTDSANNWIKNMRSAVLDQGLSFDDIKTNNYLGFTAAYGVQNATRITDSVFQTKPVIMMDVMSDMAGTNKIGKTHNFEWNNLLYIDGHVSSFHVGILYSVTSTDVENWRYNFNIWDNTGLLD
jgi:prepilin-type N-terminal cleavage/methylation domain-containing protein